MKKNKKLLAVASAGGHWTQLQLLSQAYTSHDVHFLTTTINKSTNSSNGKVSKVMDADSTNKLKLMVVALQVLVVLLKVRPKVIISTGASPGYFAIVFGKIMGAKTIWVDSMANNTKLSLSGKHAINSCDLFLTQWPELADNEKVNYAGRLL